MACSQNPQAISNFPQPPAGFIAAQGFHANPNQDRRMAGYYVLPHPGVDNNGPGNGCGPHGSMALTNSDNQAAHVTIGLNRKPTIRADRGLPPIQTSFNPAYGQPISSSHRENFLHPGASSPISTNLHNGVPPTAVRTLYGPHFAGGQGNISHPASPQKLSAAAEEQIMNISHLAKVRILRKISPPLKSSNNKNQATPTSDLGLIIAIEGDDESVTAKIFEKLREHLRREEDCNVWAFTGVAQPTKGKQTRIADYYSLILDWLKTTNNTIVNFVRSTTNPMDTTTTEAMDEDDKSDSTLQDASENATADHVHVQANDSSQGPLNIVLIERFQLYASNIYSCSITIEDQYAPADHWQWMATMWRGAVGPDLTIFVKDCEPEEMLKERQVDIREEIQCVTLRRNKTKRDGSIDETALRRLCFEVGEIVRARKLKRDHPDLDT